MLKQRARDRMYKRAVGALVLFSAFALVFVLRMYQLASGPFDQSVRLHAIAPRAHGLELDSPVTMAGLKIGRVVGIAVTPDSRIKLELEVQGKYRERLRGDSLATVSRPLIGSSFIDVSMGSPDKDELPSGALIGLRTLPDIDDVVASIPPKLAKIDALLDNVGVILGNVTDASADFKQLVRQVGNDLKPLDRSLHNVEKTSAEAAAAATGVKEAVVRARSAIDDAGQAVTQVNAILADVKQGSARVDALMKRADNILANGETISRELTAVTPQIAPVIDAGRDALNEADDVLRAAKNNVLLRGGVTAPASGTLPASSR